ncbi:MAG: hypothetical protein WC768_02855 [Patescibacteria group bacterium]|jgi:hypothetical protein
MFFYPLKQKQKSKKIRQFSLKLKLGILAFFVLIYPNLALARTFNPSDIIDDGDLTDKNALSKTAIQKFLERENSVLARYSQEVDGKAMTAAEIIWTIGQKHNINPKFLLTTLEKEQSLIHKTQATEKALDWATGYSCYGNTCKDKYRGFYNQLEASAETQQIYWNKAGQFSFKVGQTTKSLDGYSVTPQNKATANLYIYTPYVGYSPELGVTAPYGGNRLFWRIWHRYFSDQKFLDGQVLTDNSNYWLVSNNTKKKFASKELFLTDYKLSDAIFTSAKDLAAYPDGSPINFTENSLVKSSVTGQMFLLADGQKRLIVDQTSLALLADFRIAVTENEVPTVNEALIANYPLGPTITATSVYPQGKLFKDETGQIWQIKDGLKHAVDAVVWKNNFNSQEPEIGTAADLGKYPTGDPVKLKDGTFVLVDNKYYLITAGERMRIEDSGIFDRVFGPDKKDSALKVSQALLEIHGASDVIDYIDDTITDPIGNSQNPNPAGETNALSASLNSMKPEGLIMVTGNTATVTMKFKNNGTTTWQNSNVYLKITDAGKTTSSFAIPEKISPAETNIASSQLATFTFNLTAPINQAGLLTQEMTLFYNQNGTPAKITSIAKFIIVKPAVTGQIIKNTIPVSIKKTTRTSVIIRIKNTSNITWQAKKTTLGVFSIDGLTSQFYDKKDWLSKDVAAIPIGKKIVKPGETAEFRFILDPRPINKGSYTMILKLKLSDKGQAVFIDGQDQFEQEIIVK